MISYSRARTTLSTGVMLSSVWSCRMARARTSLNSQRVARLRMEVHSSSVRALKSPKLLVHPVQSATSEHTEKKHDSRRVEYPEQSLEINRGYAGEVQRAVVVETFWGPADRLGEVKQVAEDPGVSRKGGAEDTEKGILDLVADVVIKW